MEEFMQFIKKELNVDVPVPLYLEHFLLLLIAYYIYTFIHPDFANVNLSMQITTKDKTLELYFLLPCL